MPLWRSYDCLISTMGFPILVRQHLYIESGPRSSAAMVLTKLAQNIQVTVPEGWQVTVLWTKWLMFADEISKYIFANRNYCAGFKFWNMQFLMKGLVKRDSGLTQIVVLYWTMMYMSSMASQIISNSTVCSMVYVSYQQKNWGWYYW